MALQLASLSGSHFKRGVTKANFKLFCIINVLDNCIVDITSADGLIIENPGTLEIRDKIKHQCFRVELVLNQTTNTMYFGKRNLRGASISLLVLTINPHRSSV